MSSQEAERPPALLEERQEEGMTRNRLTVDLLGLMAAFENASWETSYYLDLETGEVIMLTDEELGYVDEPPDWPLPEWQQEAVKRAKEIWLDGGERYLRLPDADSREGYRDMEDFIITVEDEHLRELLSVAVSGRGAFRRFKDVLYDYPRERKRWFNYGDTQVRERVLDWLESEGIEPIIEEIEEPEEEELESPSDRDLCLTEALAFVRQAIQMPGVDRIALLGSLTTDRPDPKDVDLLVTVADNMDLKPLAAAARRLSGHLQQHRLGADVFLGDPQGRYLGRTCPWKVCAPGVRMSCDARHCGQRPYLHDDWDAVRLEDALVRRPPVALWPHVIVRVPLPEDVEKVLVQPLVDEGLSVRADEPWTYDVQSEGRCVHCQRQLPVLELAKNLPLCADCLRRAADLLDGGTHDR
jgi:predicted nucleotidyltransferase